MKYLKLEEPEKTKSEGILRALDHAFETFEMPDYKQKLVGFCTDGANVMMGERDGVIKLLKDRGQVDYVLAVWCFAHKLELQYAQHVLARNHSGPTSVKSRKY